MLSDAGRIEVVTLPADYEDGALLAQKIVAAMRDHSFLSAIYPALFTEGIDEGSLHAYMLSALVLVGDRLGFSPVSDAPVFDRLDKLLMGEGAKRPDAVWFERGRQTIRCLIEFERYTPRSLAPKARNLLIMGKELQPAPQLVVLNYWTYTSLSASALSEVLSAFAHGFQHASGMTFPPLGCPALALETLVVSSGERTSVTATVPRLFVSGREDKPYIVQRLNAL